MYTIGKNCEDAMGKGFKSQVSLLSPFVYGIKGTVTLWHTEPRKCLDHSLLYRLRQNVTP